MAGNSFTQIHDTSNTRTWSYFYPQIPACKGREKIVYIHANQHKHHGSWERSPQRAISKVTSITAVCDYRVSVGSPDRPGDRAGVGPHAPAHHTHTRPPITSWRRAPHHHPPPPPPPHMQETYSTLFLMPLLHGDLSECVNLSALCAEQMPATFAGWVESIYCIWFNFHIFFIHFPLYHSKCSTRVKDLFTLGWGTQDVVLHLIRSLVRIL